MSGPPPTYPHDYAVLVAGDVKPVIVTLKAEGIEPGIHHHACGFHRLLARKFPFAIYYDIEGKEARVWAVVDCRRDPSWITQTLSSRRKRKSK